MLAEAAELAHLAGAWEDYVGEGGHSLSAMQAPNTNPNSKTLTLALTLTDLDPKPQP